MTAIIPLTPDDLGGPSVSADVGFEVLGRREDALIVEFFERPEDVDWFDDFEMMYCQMRMPGDSEQTAGRSNRNDAHLDQNGGRSPYNDAHSDQNGGRLNQVAARSH